MNQQLTPKIYHFNTKAFLSQLSMKYFNIYTRVCNMFMGKHLSLKSNLFVIFCFKRRNNFKKF